MFVVHENMTIQNGERRWNSNRAGIVLKADPKIVLRALEILLMGVVVVVHCCVEYLCLWSFHLGHKDDKMKGLINLVLTDRQEFSKQLLIK